VTKLSDEGVRLCVGRYYVNKRGDVLGPMRQTFTEAGQILTAAGLVPETTLPWVHDQYGTQYNARTGDQYGHAPASTGNIAREATEEERASLSTDVGEGL
jgi:hypothetical protein